jgi:4-hydroxy-tetrahydrodipicolinate reductase
MIRITVVGAGGRMGRRLLTLVNEADDLELIAGVEHPKNVREHGENLRQLAGSAPIMEELPAEPGVVVDFSLPVSTMKHLNIAVMREAPFVCGVTGLSDNQLDTINKAAESIPMLFAENMSVGVNLLRRLVRQVAKELEDGYEIEITEAHHHSKRDAPSGTALGLARAIIESTERTNGDLIYGRAGEIGARLPKEIGIHALRMGAEVGEHKVHFASAGEVLTLSHRAYSRDTFVLGALRAARWIVDRKPGLYTMDDVLGA